MQLSQRNLMYYFRVTSFSHEELDNFRLQKTSTKHELNYLLSNTDLVDRKVGTSVQKRMRIFANWEQFQCNTFKYRSNKVLRILGTEKFDLQSNMFESLNSNIID